MPPVVIDIRRADDSRDVVHRAVQALAEGKLVAFPTETVYGLAASALNEQAVEKILHAKGRPESQPLTLAIKSADDALDYVPAMLPVAMRLARRCWPGPLTLVLEDDHPESLKNQLPAGVKAAVSPNGLIGLRVPAHPLILDVLRLLPGPLALTSANRSGQPDAVTAEEVVAALDGEVALVLDDGRSQFAQPSSVVRVTRKGLDVLRLGVVSAQALRRLSSFMILMVCTGNTCRSPMAALLCMQRIAQRLGCRPDEVEDRGVVVASAGIAAMAGGRPSAEAVTVMSRRGLDLTSHESQPLTPRLVRDADLIFTMTRSHRDAILAQWPNAASRVMPLSPDYTDVSDPIGGPTELYSRCAEQIDAALESRLSELDLQSIILPE